MTKRIISLAALLFTFVSLSAQEYTPTVANSNDLRGRVEGAFEWEFAKDLSLEASVQMRLKSDFSTVDRIQSGVGLTYEPTKYFNFGADYFLINGHDPEGWDKPRHRVNVNAEGSVKAGRFEFSLRERVQTTFRTDSVNRYEKMNPEIMLRSKLTVEYNIRHSRWTPYLMFELNNTLNAPKVVGNYKSDPLAIDNYVSRYRAGVGAKFKVTKKHRLDFYYYFDYNRSYDIGYKGNKGALKEYVQENECRHIFGISYKFKL
ncbi:MAG: DUF2490 domain-containing protein [Alistipes sp.]|nr:DUF2490 domain-containing protein [Alistipes sp.]